MTEVYNTLVLDAQGLSAWVSKDRKHVALIGEFYEWGSRLVASANTIIEVSHARLDMPRLNWVLSRVKVEPVTEDSAKAAAKLLKEAGLHGHKYALDASVAEAALRQPGPVAMLTSDLDDMAKLCRGRVVLIPC
ncbi:DNA-binding protein [Nonomuraea typhae]|uniref:DNA-binding protein n=1 Tax=Nonomuraea typhae TaxID=2603600 RepID=A0ABW7YWD4_9ACTN